ncbi:MAG TPA: ThuA domain-containing protein [Verrucomicrobiales bacterium]|nr:ThuA domain-containing protein [Verrucomicrobiales bacterium]
MKWRFIAAEVMARITVIVVIEGMVSERMRAPPPTFSSSMKILRFVLPAVCLASVTVLCTGQQDKKNDFTVSPDKVEKIKAALPAATPAPVQKKHEVLVFTRTKGFRHGSIPVGVECMKQLGAKTGLFNVTHTEDPEVFAADSLKKFDAVIMLNTTGRIFEGAASGEEVLKKNLLEFVKNGGGLAGMHSATDTYNDWKEYNDLMGGSFESHPWGSGDTVRVKNLDPQHPLNAAFKNEGLTVKDEIYKFRPKTAQPSGRRMLLALDPNGTDMKKDDGNKDGAPDRDFYPIAWLSTSGKGKTFYCSLGHNDEIYWNPTVVQHYLAGIQYALGELPADATPKAVAMVLNDGRLVAGN